MSLRPSQTVLPLSLLSALLLAPVAFSQAADPLDAAPVLDRVVAVVEGRPISLSELEFETRVALVQRGGVEAAGASLDVRALEGGLELAINQRLQAMEADKVQAFQIEADVLEGALKTFRERFPSRELYVAFLQRHDVDESQLAAVLERGLRAERVLDSRVRLKAQVSEAEVRRYFDANRERLGEDYAQMREAIREKLTRERYVAFAAEEMASLRKLSRVRQVAPIAEVAQ
jgi:hypothetical protein